MTKNSGQFQPGHPKLANSGRRKGTPNKITAQVRDAMGQTATLAGPMLEQYMQNLIAKDPSGLDIRLRHQALMDILHFTCDRAGVHKDTGHQGDKKGA